VESKKLRYAVIGAGGIAVTEHLPAWAARTDAELVSVVDVDAGRAQAAAERFGASGWHTDYRELLREGGIDAVDICSPPAFHREMTVDFLDAGIHVLLEKPFVLNLEDAAAVVEADARSSAVLMIAENWPYASAVTRVVRAVQDGLLGDLYMLRAHHENSIWDAEPELLPPGMSLAQAGGGLTMSAGIHALNLARYLMGDISEVFAYSTPPGATPQPWIDRDVVLAARCGEERLVSMNFTGRSRLLEGRRLAFTVFGTRGVAEFEMLTGEVTIVHDGTSTTYVDAAPSMGYAEEIDHFLDCVRSGSAVRTTAADQVGTIATVLAVYESMATGQVARPAHLSSKARDAAPVR
jgi:predicted dehydrogenase